MRPGLRLLGCALLMAGCSSPATGERIPPTMTIAEIMANIVMPAADVLWGATAVYMTEEGEDDRSPETSADWQKVEDARMLLAEASEALLDTSRPVDVPGVAIEHPAEELSPEQVAALIEAQPELWASLARAMAETAGQAKQAIADQDVDALLEIGGTLYENCDGCHRQFWYPKP